jgi:hypothetical protein
MAHLKIITSCLQDSIFTTPKTTESSGQIIYEAVMRDFMTKLRVGGGRHFDTVLRLCDAQLKLWAEEGEEKAL